VGTHVTQGSAYVFGRSASAWAQTSHLFASDGSGFDNFGQSVAIDSIGESSIVGARQDKVGTQSNQGSAYLFGNIIVNAAGGEIALSGADMILGAPISSSLSVSILPSGALAIQLGTIGDSVANTIELSDAELDRVTAPQLAIGDVTSGPISITANISRISATNITLTSAGAINFTSGSIDTDGGELVLAPGVSSIVGVAKAGNDVAGDSLTFLPGATLSIVINGAAVDAGYSQLNVIGQVDLTGVNLAITGSYTPTFGQAYVIVANDGIDPTVGTFNGMPEGYLFANFLGSSLSAVLHYNRGDGNDVVLNVLQPPAFYGDYNRNGVVDAADYTVWRDTLGANVAAYTKADGDGNGAVNQADYTKWRANFGTTGDSGVLGNGLAFDGVNDFVDMGDPADNHLDLGTNVTIEAWVKFNALPVNNFMTIVSKDSGGGIKKKWIYAYANNYNGISNATIFVDDSGSSEVFLHSNSWTPVAGQWYHFSLVKNGNNYTFYRDGVADGTASTTIQIPDVNANLLLGQAEGSFRLNGELDDVRIWNVAETAQEIAGNKNAELVGNETGLVGYWRLNETSGATVADGSPFGTTGTINGLGSGRGSSFASEGSAVFDRSALDAALTISDDSTSRNTVGVTVARLESSGEPGAAMRSKFMWPSDMPTVGARDDALLGWLTGRAEGARSEERISYECGGRKGEGGMRSRCRIWRRMDPSA
jgi:hypothetical protein